jgi:hypothetical protein
MKNNSIQFFILVSCMNSQVTNYRHNTKINKIKTELMDANKITRDYNKNYIIMLNKRKEIHRRLLQKKNSYFKI